MRYWLVVLAATLAACGGGSSSPPPAPPVVEDTTPPVITLTGDNPQLIEAGEAYTELGATASDNVDGDLSASIVIDASTVDTTVPGDYTVTYDVSDSSGNAAATLTRTVSVRDTTPPIITLIGDNPQTIEAGEEYTELGATASDNVDSDLTPLIIIDSSDLDPLVPGDYTVNYVVRDAAGNIGMVTRTVLVRDTLPPVITLVGSDPQIIEACRMVYTELGATAWDIVEGDLTASIVIDDSDVNSELHADYVVTYDVVDAAGNVAETVIRTVRVVLPPPNGDQFFGVDSSSDSLFLIDSATGAGCLVGRLDPLGNADPNLTPNRFATPVSMAIDNSGSLYVINNSRCFADTMQDDGYCRDNDESKTELVIVDPSSGAAVSISDPSGADPPKPGLNTLAFDPVGDALYGVGIYIMQPAGEGTLTLIDTIEGKGVPVGRILAGQSSMQMYGADFDSCGNLYAVNGDGVLIRLDASEIAAANSDIVPDMQADIVGIIPSTPVPGSIVFDRDNRLLGTLIDGGYFEIDTSNASVTPIGTLREGHQGLGFVFDPSRPRHCN